MPKYTPTDEDLESLYSEPEAEVKAPESEAMEAEEPEAPEGGEGEGGEDASETLIAKSALPTGVKEGDVISVRVTKDYGDECGLEVVSKGMNKATEQESADDEIEALDKE